MDPLPSAAYHLLGRVDPSALTLTPLLLYMQHAFVARGERKIQPTRKSKHNKLVTPQAITVRNASTLQKSCKVKVVRVQNQAKSHECILQGEPIHTFQKFFPHGHFNIILPSTSTSSKSSLSFRLFKQYFIGICHCPFACYIPHPCHPP
jgi:hypothetical protein